jgi:hypothetical protein
MGDKAVEAAVSRIFKISGVVPFALGELRSWLCVGYAI